MSRHAPCGATFAAQQRRGRGTIGTGYARGPARMAGMSTYVEIQKFVQQHRVDRELRLQLHSQAQNARLFDLRQLMSGPLRTRTPIVTASHGSQQSLAGLSIDVIYIR